MEDSSRLEDGLRASVDGGEVDDAIHEPDVDAIRRCADELWADRADADHFALSGDCGLYAAERGGRPRSLAVGGVCQSTPAWSKSLSL